VVKPILGAEPDQAILDGEAERFNKLAGILDAQLAGRDWVSTPDPSIADIALAAPMHLHRHQKLPLENYGNIRAWIARMEELPAWKSTDVAPLLGLS
jgi:glutathione S-transferase